MNELVTFIVEVFEQQTQLAPTDRAFLWLLACLCTMIAIILLTVVILHILDGVKWLVKSVKAHRQWQRERKFYQQINKIRNESYGANRGNKITFTVKRSN